MGEFIHSLLYVFLFEVLYQLLASQWLFHLAVVYLTIVLLHDLLLDSASHHIANNWVLESASALICNRLLNPDLIAIAIAVKSSDVWHLTLVSLLPLLFTLFHTLVFVFAFLFVSLHCRLLGLTQSVEGGSKHRACP